MPTPQELLNYTQSSSRPSSVVSRSSSLATVSVASTTTSNTSRNMISRMTDQGLNREYHIVHRRPRHQQDLTAPSSGGVAPHTKDNVQTASKIFLAELASKHCWPAGNLKASMAQEALSQANAAAQSKGRPTTEFTTAIKAQVHRINHYGYCIQTHSH